MDQRTDWRNPLVSVNIYIEGGGDSKELHLRCRQWFRRLLEQRPRHEVQDKLVHATRHCSNKYEKGRRSFEILGRLKPDVLKKNLPGFIRVHRILTDKL